MLPHLEQTEVRDRRVRLADAEDPYGLALAEVARRHVVQAPQVAGLKHAAEPARRSPARVRCRIGLRGEMELVHRVQADDGRDRQ